MAPKIFVTGATGYIGGDALYLIYNAHPDWEYTALVRNSDRGAVVAKEYPKIRLVYGDLDSSSTLLEEESKNADIVLHFADADNEPSARAIAKGLAAHTPARPGFWIHTSGTGILLFHDMKRNVYGDEHPKIYDDIANIDELTTLPEDALHRNIDMIVQGAASDSVKTAIVCPPAIYDKGRGPGNQRSIQVPSLARGMIDFNQAFYVGEGKTFWSNVNVQDLSSAYLALAEAAAAGGGNATWGRNGYYFTENGEHRWGDISRKLGQILHKMGAIKSPEAVGYSPEQVNKAHPYGSLLWGGNSRSRASRLHKELGWTPKERSIEASLEDSAALEKEKADKGQAA